MTVSKPSMPISTISIWHALQLATGEAGRLRDLTGIEAGQLGSLAAWQLGSLAVAANLHTLPPIAEEEDPEERVKRRSCNLLPVCRDWN